MPEATCQSVGFGCAFSSGGAQSGRMKVSEELTLTLPLMLKYGKLFAQRTVQFSHLIFVSAVPPPLTSFSPGGASVWGAVWHVLWHA